MHILTRTLFHTPRVVLLGVPVDRLPHPQVPVGGRGLGPWVGRPSPLPTSKLARILGRNCVLSSLRDDKGGVRIVHLFQFRRPAGSTAGTKRGPGTPEGRTIIRWVGICSEFSLGQEIPARWQREVMGQGRKTAAISRPAQRRGEDVLRRNLHQFDPNVCFSYDICEQNISGEKSVVLLTISSEEEMAL